MNVTRRDFLKASAALAGALGLDILGLPGARSALGLETKDGGVPVVWLQGQCCSGCSVSILNSIVETTIDDLLLNRLDVEFHPTLMAAAGNLAVTAAEKAYRRGGYVLLVEGALPTAAGGKYCEMWPGLTAARGVERFARRASLVMAIGTCASFGGMVRGSPNPTGARGLEDEYDGKRVVRIPGCPTHPDWVVGTVAHILSTGTVPELDTYGRPLDFFATRVHDRCPLREADDAETLGRPGCLVGLGCKGPSTRADCPSRHWNAGGAGEIGVNWCAAAGSPCIGCTEASFPDGKSPFFTLD